jgi:exodeoxyribonuclease V gamma subunit
VRASFDLPLLESLGFELELGACRLGGVLNKLTAAGLRVSSYRKLGVHTLLDLWPRHLVLNVLRPPGIECRSELLTVEGLHVLRPLADADTARVLLADLLDLRAEGLRSPLPFMPRSAWALLREKDGEKAARNAWLGGFRPGECEDPWYTLLYRQAPSDLPPGFADCARRVLAPLLAQLAEPAT